jgi:hypothetical protein
LIGNVKPAARLALIVIGSAIALLAQVAPAAGASSARMGAGDSDSQAAVSGGPDLRGPVLFALAPCSDDAYSLLGGSWPSTLNWWYQSSSTPYYLDQAATLAVLQRSFANITDAYNDCGLPDQVGATAAYQGDTGLKPNVNKRARCGRRDGVNVIGFGRLPWGTLAVTCLRYSGDDITETDILINSRLAWALSVDSCTYEELLEPTMTHEIGHAFGLGHVGERRHGRLTMSTTADGICSNVESTLGLGDFRGLSHLYPL